MGVISPDELVVLDDRERASGLGSALAKILGRAPKIERLSAGDILVARRYLIERKTTEDFAASVLDGRLFNQIAQMREQRFEPVLILEGEFKPGEAQRLSPGALRGAILSVALDWRVPIVRSRGIADTALWIQSLLRRIEKKTAPPDWRGVTPDGRRIPKSQIPQRPRRKALPPEQEEHRRNLAMLEKFPGIGRKKAAALLKRFGNFSGLVAATIFEVAEVEGVGVRLAEQLYRLIHDSVGKGPNAGK